MKKTLIFELFASILVVGLLAGLNALMGKSSELDRELTLLSGKPSAVSINAHRRHGGRHGHAGRHHERRRHEGSQSRVSDNHAGQQHQVGQQQPAGGNAPATHNAAPPAQPAPATLTPVERPRVQ